LRWPLNLLSGGEQRRRLALWRLDELSPPGLKCWTVREMKLIVRFAGNHEVLKPSNYILSWHFSDVGRCPT
jgi:hypothetical protein